MYLTDLTFVICVQYFFPCILYSCVCNLYLSVLQKCACSLNKVEAQPDQGFEVVPHQSCMIVPEYGRDVFCICHISYFVHVLWRNNRGAPKSYLPEPSALRKTQLYPKVMLSIAIADLSFCKQKLVFG